MHGRVPCYGRGVCLVIQKNYSSGDKAPAAKEILLTSDVYRTVQSVFPLCRKVWKMKFWKVPWALG